MLALLNLASSGHVPPSMQEMAHLHKLQAEHAARPARQLSSNDSKPDYTCSDNARSASDDWRVSGTSLGGWLVLEPWLTPSLFYQFLGADETYGPALCQKQGPAHEGSARAAPQPQASPAPVQRTAPGSGEPLAHQPRAARRPTLRHLAARAPHCPPWLRRQVRRSTTSGSRQARQHGQSSPLAGPQLGSCASAGRAWRLRAARHSQGETQPLGAQPPPRSLKWSTSKVADSAAV